MVVFDKTGTLTLGARNLLRMNVFPTMLWPLPPGSLLRASILTRARSSPPRNSGLGRVVPASGVEEVPGRGLKRSLKQGEERIGSAEWCGVESGGEESEVWYRRDSRGAGSLPLR